MANLNVLQFGEGNFLRGFIDLALQKLADKNLWDGEVYVVSPIDSDFIIDKLNAQNGKYTVSLAGILGGNEVNELSEVTVIKQAFNAVKQWQDTINIATSKDTKVIISNTTEAGIEYVEEKAPNNDSVAPNTFPAKMTWLLYKRYLALSDEKLTKEDAKIIIVPCELIEAGGQQLSMHIIHYAYDWGLSDNFISFIKESCVFYNTLVDRIVPGYPKDEAEDICKRIGHSDEIIVKAEPFGFFGLERSDGIDIEADNPIEAIIPFSQSDLDVNYTNNLKPYRERKVHLLNAPHTAMSMMGSSSSIETVREMVTQEPFMSKIQALMFDEIIPMLDLPKEELEDFANSVLDRFRNPYNRHELASIALNEQSKYEVRILPIIKRYEAKKLPIPPVLGELAKIAKDNWGI